MSTTIPPICLLVYLVDKADEEVCAWDGCQLVLGALIQASTVSNHLGTARVKLK